MSKINHKKPKMSSRERHLKWIEHYGSKNFGMWVECTKCKKWRKTFDYTEAHEVPDEWRCSMLTLENGKKGNCRMPEEENAEEYLEYAPGSVVWAKLEGYPWWPAMVDGDPETDEYAWQDNDTVYYNVTFMDNRPTHQWIPKMYVRPFLETPKAEKGPLQKVRKNRYASAIAKAKERAEKAMEMTIKDRLQTYSFVHLYKGRWPAVSDSEDSEENGSGSVVTDVPLKKSTKRKSAFPQKHDDERRKKELFEKNVPELKKKTDEAKYLNKKNFIPERRMAHPYTRSISSSHDQEILADSSKNVNSFLLNEVIKIKRWSNRKFTPVRPVHNSTEDNFENIVLERGSNEISKKAVTPKNDYSKTVHISKNPNLEGSENDVTDVPNDENHEAENKTKKVKFLNRKVFIKKTNIFADESNRSHISSKEEITKHENEGNGHVKNHKKKFLKMFDERNNFEQKNNDKKSNEIQNKIIKTSDKLKKNSIKHKKLQNFLRTMIKK